MVILGALACTPSPQQQNSEKAAEVLRQTGVPDFVDASTADFAALRHQPSGMVCRLPLDGVLEVNVFPASAANPGAHCAVAQGRSASTFVVVRFGAGVSLDDAFRDAAASLVAEREVALWTGRASEADRADPTGLPHFRIARYRANLNEEATYVRVAVAEARGWFLQQVVTAPLEEADIAEEAAGTAWRAALADFARE
jgi:hypothetical protein